MTLDIQLEGGMIEQASSYFILRAVCSGREQPQG